MASTRSAMLREREEERRLNMRTLAIASGASATAAAVTSQLWIHGTWLAAALTPVLVALISEAMHRPTERLARVWTSDRPAARPARGAATEPGGFAGPVRVYRQPSSRAPRRRLALGVVIATAAIAFLIAVAVLTAGDLISGGSIGKGSGSTTFFSPDLKKQSEQKNKAPQQTTPDQPATTEQPPPADEPAPEQQPSDTAPATPPSEAPPGEPAPDVLPQ